MNPKDSNNNSSESFEDHISPLVGSFEIFMQELIDREGLPVSEKTRSLAPKDLFRLNGLLHFQSRHVTVRSKQENFPLAHLLYKLSLDGKFASFQRRKGKTHLVVDEDYYKEFLKLSLAARYVFLLEIFWTQMDLDALRENLMSIMTNSDVFGLAQKYPPGTVLYPFRPAISTDKKVTYRLYLPYLPAYFLWFFGFYAMDIPKSAPKVDKYTFPGKSITLTAFGNQLFEILATQRPEQLWHVEMRAIFYIEEESETSTLPPFHEAFVPLFGENDLEKTLSIPDPRPVTGGFRLKVSLARDCYRVFDLAAGTFLSDLHMAIQGAFDFDNDHLFGFYMKAANSQRDYGITGSPVNYGETDENTLAMHDLFVGQTFRYVFDFGDHWEFSIKVLKYFPDWESEDIELFEKVGDSPVQYSEWDEDGDEEEDEDEYEDEGFAFFKFLDGDKDKDKN
jgi:hypothetical protein